MSAEKTGWLMFLLSSACITYTVLAGRPLLRGPSRRGLSAISSASDEYTATLKHLFTPTQGASRHLQGQSTLEIFQHRRAFYQSLYAQCNLSHCKVIHIAGTKGKGSTVECIAASLVAAGHQVGIFTSPHLHTARERIKFNNELVSREEIVSLSTQAFEQMQAVSWIPVFFDYFLTMALLYFAQRQPEFLVLECGLGGRYDSTNFCDDPLVSVITSISLDHQSVLGHTLEEIAHQKAGIMKPRVPVFTTETQQPSVLNVFQRDARESGAVLHIVPIDRESNKNWVPLGHDALIENSSLAQAVLAHLNIPRVGMKNFYWPCRMEKFQARARDGMVVPVVLDGCHNEQSVRVFVQSLRNLYPGHHVAIVFGAGAEKCVDDMVRDVAEHADSVVFAQSKHFKSVPEGQLKEKVPAAWRGKVVDAPAVLSSNGTIEARLHYAVDLFAPKAPAVIAVCGSLFAAADAREALFKFDSGLFALNDWVRFADPHI